MDTATQLLIQKMFSSVDTYRATDMHLSVGNPPMMRIGEQLIAVPDQQILTPQVLQELVFAWLDPGEQVQLQEKREIVVGKTFASRKRYKIAVFFQQGFFSMAISVVPDLIPSLAQMGLPPIVQQLATVRAGCILLLGPAGARQSLTLASMIDHLNQTTQQHIVTIEEPVEFLFNDNQCVIDQREVGRDVKSIEDGLAFTIQEDVDVVVASHIPSPTALQRLLQVAGSGKAVWSMMYTTTIVGALQQLIHSVPEHEQEQIRIQLSNTLAGVINQRAVTSRTGDTVIIAEVMVPNDSVRAIVQKGDIFQINNILMTTREQGMRSIDMALKEAVERGVITKEVAAQYASVGSPLIS